MHDMLPRVERLRVLDAMRQALWVESKALASAREHAMTRARRLHGVPSYRPATLLMFRRVKQIGAELEFLEELRRELEQAPPSGVSVSARRDEGTADGDLVASSRPVGKG